MGLPRLLRIFIFSYTFLGGTFSRRPNLLLFAFFVYSNLCVNHKCISIFYTKALGVFTFFISVLAKSKFIYKNVCFSSNNIIKKYIGLTKCSKLAKSKYKDAYSVFNYFSTGCSLFVIRCIS